MMKPELIELLGMDFDDVSARAAVEQILARPAAANFAYIVTPNADHLARLRKQPGLQRVYRAAWLRLLDSQLLHNGARLLGLAAPPVATGAALTALLLNRLEPQIVTIIGMSATDVIALGGKFPHLNFAHHAPPMNLLRDVAAFRAARDFVLASNSRFTFFAVGSPAQELLAYVVSLHEDAAGTGICIGGALKFCAGTATRAPGWMQAAGLEWLHRLVCDPRRLAHRYLVDDPPVLGALAAAALRKKVH